MHLETIQFNYDLFLTGNYNLITRGETEVIFLVKRKFRGKEDYVFLVNFSDERQPINKLDEFGRAYTTHFHDEDVLMIKKFLLVKVRR